jgi:hypothetical protein
MINRLEDKEMRRAVFSLLIVLIFSMVVGAQSINRKTLGGMLSPGLSLTGIQNHTGIYDPTNDKCWGNSFVLRGAGEWFTAHMTISMDYVNGLPDPKFGNAVVLGNWAMTVYRDNENYTTLFGYVTGGNITWTLDPSTGVLTSRGTSVRLVVAGDLNAPEKLWEDPYQIELNATTRLTGTRAVTVATLNNF